MVGGIAHDWYLLLCSFVFCLHIHFLLWPFWAKNLCISQFVEFAGYHRGTSSATLSRFTPQLFVALATLRSTTFIMAAGNAPIDLRGFLGGGPPPGPRDDEGEEGFDGEPNAPEPQGGPRSR